MVDECTETPLIDMTPDVVRDQKLTFVTKDKEKSEEAFSYYVVESVKFHNSEKEANGRFRRFVTTRKGVNFTVWNDQFTLLQAVWIAYNMDTVAEANYAAGDKQARRDIRDALGLSEASGVLRVKR